jgi:hypothetical protein
MDVNATRKHGRKREKCDREPHAAAAKAFQHRKDRWRDVERKRERAIGNLLDIDSRIRQRDRMLWASDRHTLRALTVALGVATCSLRASSPREVSLDNISHPMEQAPSLDGPRRGV